MQTESPNNISKNAQNSFLEMFSSTIILNSNPKVKIPGHPAYVSNRVRYFQKGLTNMFMFPEDKVIDRTRLLTV